MTRMIITTAQLKAINEAFTAPTVLYANDATTPGVTAAVKSTNDTGNTFSVKTPGTGGTVSATLPELERGINLNNASRVDVIKDPNKTQTEMTESNKYTKRQVELGRMLEMRRTGKVFSKRQLNEMMLSRGHFDDYRISDQELEEISDRSNELADSYITADSLKRCPAFDVLTTFGCIFPDDNQEMLELFSRGKNPTEFILSVYNSASPEDKELFRKKLGI